MIEYVVKKPTEYVYGYLVWSKEEDEIYRKIFPEGEFDVIFDGKIVPSRKVDWKRRRLCLYPAPPWAEGLFREKIEISK